MSNPRWAGFTPRMQAALAAPACQRSFLQAPSLPRLEKDSDIFLPLPVVLSS